MRLSLPLFGLPEQRLPQGSGKFCHVFGVLKVVLDFCEYFKRTSQLVDCVFESDLTICFQSPARSLKCFSSVHLIQRAMLRRHAPGLENTAGGLKTVAGMLPDYVPELGPQQKYLSNGRALRN